MCGQLAVLLRHGFEGGPSAWGGGWGGWASCAALWLGFGRRLLSARARPSGLAGSAASAAWRGRASE
eukprot:7447952-Alexandrium_andersonii.AAC.1